MPFTNQKSETSKSKIFYEDLGAGTTVILIHGWPASNEMWEYQKSALIEAGFRVISYDRKGFGKSDKPMDGYTYDSFADDLNVLINELNLDKVILAGFSMGGGEIARYLGKYTSAKVSKVALISSVLPYLSQSDKNPDGVPVEMFDEMKAGIKEDRPAFLQTFAKNFFGVNLLTNPVSDGILQWMFSLAIVASPIATVDCVTAFGTTDFSSDMKAFDIPTLIIHGSDDKIVPIKGSSDISSQLIKGAHYKKYDGAPHGLFITHKDELNKDLVEFFRN